MTEPGDPAPPHRFPLAVIGAGALGLHFVSRLAPVVPLALIARSANRAADLAAGVDVGGHLYQPTVFSPPFVPEADWVLILVKGPDTKAAGRLAATMAPRGVLSLQNGLTETALRSVCPAGRVGQGITTAGAYRDGARVVPTADGTTLLPPGFEPMAAWLAEAGFEARISPNIAAERLAKLLVNVAINPLAAIFCITNGALLAPPHRVLLDALVDEAWPVLRRAGLALDLGAAREWVAEVAARTGANRASMLQDILAGRATEIETITGALLAMAAAQGVVLPTHEAVRTLVRRLEGASAATSQAPGGLPD
ncbi:MAG: 2-dehydropantoate 2-reductase [Zoogloeaceae bacterium]|nr:2-dehydropantoate 2-reductase [Zoogloeaceae bacterium]